MTSIHNMLWFLHRKPNSQPPVDLDADPQKWEGGEGREEPEATSDPGLGGESRHLIPAAMDARRLADRLVYGENCADFVHLDIPELGLVELHFERRGEGIWYATLVDCEDGRILACGRLHRR